MFHVKQFTYFSIGIKIKHYIFMIKDNLLQTTYNLLFLYMLFSKTL